MMAKLAAMSAPAAAPAGPSATVARLQQELGVALERVSALEAAALKSQSEPAGADTAGLLPHVCA
jgi:hypothetical protein